MAHFPIAFKDVPLYGRFNTGKMRGSGINSENWLQEDFEKNSKSTAICIAQHGYGNTRGVGGTRKFAPNATVYVWK